MKIKRIISNALSFILAIGVAFTVVSCQNGEEENETDIGGYEYTVNNLYGIDDLGREFFAVDSIESDRSVGLFYFLWLGQHGVSPTPYDITKLLEKHPEDLWNTTGTYYSPTVVHHFWGEPLYGYYNQQDEWVVRRHMEMITLSGVDWLGFDATNSWTYDECWMLICKVLQEMYDQGFDVPKIVFYTNTDSYDRVKHLYDVMYSQGLYKDLWYAPNGKPMIIGVKSTIQRYDPSLLEFFDVRSSQWPGAAVREDGIPWLCFERPQTIHGDFMSVSVAQQLRRFSEAWPTSPTYRPNASWGRGYTKANGFDYDKERIMWGDNFQEEWDVAYNNENVKNVFVTSFNEWVAQKIIEDNQVCFTDCFNMEYSRDIEPMNGGYGDNYWMQFVANCRKFKTPSSEKENVNLTEKTIDIAGDLAQWDSVNGFMDPRRDAIQREHIGAWQYTYKDNSNRNDIVYTQIANDDEYLYFNIEVAYELVTASEDANWMNLYINVLDNADKGLAGYNFVINRERDIDAGKAKIMSVNEQGQTRVVGECDINVREKNILFKVPRSALGLTENNKIAFKVTDNIQKVNDPMDFYVSGDCAPIGKFSYSYGM